MKTSNIIYLILGVALMSLFFGNIYYHKANFEERRPTLKQEAMFQRYKVSIRVVCVTDSSGKLFQKLTFINNTDVKFEMQYGTKQQGFSFYRALRFSDDTLFVEKPLLIEHPELNRPEIFIKLIRLEKYYYNGKLIKTYTHREDEKQKRIF